MNNEDLKKKLLTTVDNSTATATKESIRKAWQKSNEDKLKLATERRTRRSNMIGLDKVSEVTKRGRDFLEKSALENRIKKLEEKNKELQNRVQKCEEEILKLKVKGI